MNQDLVLGKKPPDKFDEQLVNNNTQKVECTYCKLKVTIPFDPKQISNKKSLHLCLVCGQVFEYINPGI